MQGTVKELLRKAVSHERLEGYRQRGTYGDESNLYAHYIWNIVLCESLYPVLQGLEVTLRNSMHDTFCQQYGSEEWYEIGGVLEPRDQRALGKAKRKLTETGKPHEPGRIIAELSFGFWTSLFDVRYETRFWHKLLKDVFPDMPKHLRKRKTISKRLNKIRHLRNRVFHHEPIWYWQDLAQQHEAIVETIAWINPAMAILLENIDRFPTVYGAEIDQYEQLVQGLFKE